MARFSQSVNNLITPTSIKDTNGNDLITFTKTGTGAARIGTPQDDLSLRSARDITLFAGSDGPGNVYIGWGDAVYTPNSPNRVATMGDIAAGSNTSDIFYSTNNGQGTNYKVGDDAWIGDVNAADTISIKGVEDASRGYIIFGSSTKALGSNSTEVLTYGGAVIPTVTPITNTLFVDFLRSDSYTADGSRSYPFKTLASAVTAANAIANSTYAINIVLLSGNATAENVTFNTGHVWLTGENSSGTHSPILFTGNLTFTATAGTISDNHFAVSNLMLNGVSGTEVITFSGTYPQRLFLKDVWVTANGTAHGINMTNTGSGSSVHSNELKLSHNGTGHHHCLHVAAGTANLDSIETSGANVGVIGVDGGSVNLSNSDIQGGGTYAIDVYAGGVITLANCKITTTANNSTGIDLKAAGALAVIGNVSFTIPTGSGRAVDGVTGSVLYYGPAYFLPISGSASNNKVNPNITRFAVATAWSVA